MIRYNRAVAQAMLGQEEEAWSLLEEAVDGGFHDIRMLEHTDGLAPLLEEAEWPILESRMRENWQALRPPETISYRQLDPAGQPAFETLSALVDHYTQKLRGATRWHMVSPSAVATPRVWNVLNAKMAGLERYRQKQLSDEERLAADSELLKTVILYEGNTDTPWLTSTVEAISRVADAFIEDHAGDDESCAQAAYVRARAHWLGKRPSHGLPITDELLQESVDLMREVHQTYPGTLMGLLSLVEVMETISSYKGIGDEMIREPLGIVRAEYADHPAMRQFNYKIQAYVLAADGLPDFSLTDLDGKAWHTAEMNGRVTLLDFWATWCAPCRQELPNLVELYKEYGAQGFQILGISLDDPRRLSESELKGWAKDNEMTWPLVYDGKAWQSPAVKACNVTGIPFPILLDREGKVVAAGESAAGPNLRRALKRLFPES